MKKLAIAGSTGSIGTQTLSVVRENKEELSVVSLSAGSSIDALEQQILEFSPKVVCVYEESKAKELRMRTRHLPVRICSGMEGMIETACEPSADILVGAVVGMKGILPVTEAIKAGKDIALANKETLVTAGHIIMPLVKEKKVKLLPVDSEHSAIFQCMQGENKTEVDKLLLTASGGPFRGKTKEFLEYVTVEDALRHPNWVMGKKITIDSSTMVNKGLEVIEARWLFDVSVDLIEVVIQPQSVIHSMVQFKDGAIMAQLGTPDMRLPIQYALFYPNRRMLSGERLDFKALKQITFESPDLSVFPGLALAYKAGRVGGSMPTVFNAANERAVAFFLEGKITYPQITELISFAMEQHKVQEDPDIKTILSLEQEVYELIDQKWR